MNNNKIDQEKILCFIDDFYELFCGNKEDLRMLFRCGYCWHFAHMLKDTFNQGEVCWVAPFGHFVWMCDNVPYDVEGIYVGDVECFVPESFLGDALNDFKRIPGVGFNESRKDIDRILKKWKNYNKYR